MGDKAKYLCPVCEQLLCTTVLTLVRHLVQEHVEDEGVTEAVLAVPNQDVEEYELETAEISVYSEEIKIEPEPLETDLVHKDAETLLESPPKASKSFECFICFKSFSQKINLQHHVKSVHNGERDFLCELCTKSFSTKMNLQHHIKAVHEQQKDFECEICSMRFSQKIHLLTHTRAVHEKIRDFQCNICFKRFSQKAHLAKHVNAIHMNRAKFQCELCAGAFNKKTELARHVQDEHKAEQLLHCEECSRSFKDLDKITRHMATAHGRKDFQCDVCLKSFAHKCSLVKHRKNCSART